jgi:hypothetical protein
MLASWLSVFTRGFSLAGGITGSPVISFVFLAGLVAEVFGIGAGCAGEVSVIDGAELSFFSGSA